MQQRSCRRSGRRHPWPADDRQRHRRHGQVPGGQEGEQGRGHKGSGQRASAHRRSSREVRSETSPPRSGDPEQQQRRGLEEAVTFTWRPSRHQPTRQPSRTGTESTNNVTVPCDAALHRDRKPAFPGTRRKPCTSCHAACPRHGSVNSPAPIPSTPHSIRATMSSTNVLRGRGTPRVALRFVHAVEQ